MKKIELNIPEDAYNILEAFIARQLYEQQDIIWSDCSQEQKDQFISENLSSYLTEDVYNGQYDLEMPH